MKSLCWQEITPPEALLLQQQVAYRKALGSRNRPLRERQEGRPGETV